MRKTLLRTASVIATGFALGWSGLPILGATVVTVAVFLFVPAAVAALDAPGKRT